MRCRRAAATCEAALHRYNADRQPYGACAGRSAAATSARRLRPATCEPGLRMETIMREYGAAGLVRDQPIAARAAG